jgi:hypothetical protein
MPEDLRNHWAAFRHCFTTRTHDTSEQAYDYLRAMLTMDKERCFAEISRKVGRVRP